MTPDPKRPISHRPAGDRERDQALERVTRRRRKTSDADLARAARRRRHPNPE